MAKYDNAMRGVLFKNDKKQGDNHPDYTGSAEVEGVDCWLSAWIKEDKNGKKYMSLSFTRKDEAQQQEKPQQRRGSAPPDSDIPFAPNKA